MKYDEHTKELDLILGLQKGSEDAFNEIYKRYHKLVFFVANRTCQNEADAQDIAQETFLTIRLHAQDIRNPKYFRLWVYRIISSKCKNMFHKNRRSMNPNEEDFFSSQLIEERNEFIPHQDMHFQSDLEVLNHLLDRLSEGQRFVMILFYMEQLSIHEIAQVIDIPEGTVKSRLAAARKNLQEMVLQYEQDNNQKLSFHSLPQAIALVFSASLANCIAPSLPMVKVHPTSSLIHSATSFISTHIVSSVVVASLMVGGGILAKAYVEEQASHKPEVISSSLADDTIKTIDFKAVSIEGEVIDTPKKGFYALQLSACCEKDIDDMTSEALITMKPLYEEMKKNGGAYYDNLVEIGWAQAFEKKIEEFNEIQ